MFNINNNNMRQISLLFVMLLSMMGVTQVKADNADFENALPEGWEAVGNMTYYERAKTGSYSIGNSAGSGWDNNRGNYIKTTTLQGDITFWMRSYKDRSQGYVVLFKLNEDVTVGDKLQAYSSSSSTFAEKTYTLTEPTALAIVINYAHLDNMTYTEYVVSDGPALKVTGDTDGTLNFGMVNPSETKVSTVGVIVILPVEAPIVEGAATARVSSPPAAIVLVPSKRWSWPVSGWRRSPRTPW